MTEHNDDNARAWLASLGTGVEGVEEGGVELGPSSSSSEARPSHWKTVIFRSTSASNPLGKAASRGMAPGVEALRPIGHCIRA